MRKIIFIIFLLMFFSVVHASDKFIVTLDKCIDGDTARFFINGESKIVRFLSINAPEIAHDNIKEEFYGNESSEYVCKILKKTSKIQLQYDPKSDRVDKYGRILAWIFVDGELLQRELIDKGYAEVKYVYDDYLYSNELKELEYNAKGKKLGMWGNSSGSSDFFSNIYLNELLYFSVGFIIFLILNIFKKLFFKKK